MQGMNPQNVPGAPGAQPPMGQMPMGQMPMGQMPMGQMPMGQMPMGQMPMGQMPMGQMPMMGQPPMMGPGQMGQFGGMAPSALRGEQSYVENILRMNRGKMATIYTTNEGNPEWPAKVFKGRIENAARDHVVLSDPQTGMRYMVLMVNIDYLTFDEPLQYPAGVYGR